MTEGFYKPSDIRRDGLLKMKKLKERDRIANPRIRCAMEVKDHYDVYERPCGNYAQPGKKYCHVHKSLNALNRSKGGKSDV